MVRRHDDSFIRQLHYAFVILIVLAVTASCGKGEQEEVQDSPAQQTLPPPPPAPSPDPNAEPMKTEDFFERTTALMRGCRGQFGQKKLLHSFLMGVYDGDSAGLWKSSRDYQIRGFKRGGTRSGQCQSGLASAVQQLRHLQHKGQFGDRPLRDWIGESVNWATYSPAYRGAPYPTSYAWDYSSPDN